jgi:hypothetical protein
VIGGLAYGGLPKLVGHIGLGHIGLVEAASWTPWMLLALETGLQTQARRTGRRLFALAGCVWALSFLADPRWAVPNTLLGGAWLAYRLSTIQPRGKARFLTGPLWGAGVAILLSAVLWLPMLELVQRSIRSSLSSAEASFLSLPGVGLLSILDPTAAATPEWQAYCGLMVLFLAGAAVLGRSPTSGFWVGTCIVSLMLSLGDQLPWLGSAVASLPGFSSMRVPPRFLILFGLGMSMLGALGANALLSQQLEGERKGKIRLWGFGLGVLAVSYGIVWGLRSEGNPSLDPRFMLGLSVIAVIALAWKAAPWRGIALGICLVSIAIDLAATDITQIEMRPGASVLTESGEVVSAAASLTGEGGRAYSPSYSLPQQTAAFQQLELAEGIHPLQLAAYRDFMQRATGFEASGYSVTLPPFPSGDPGEDWSPAMRTDLLGYLSVGAIASAYPVDSLGKPVEVIDGGYLYDNAQARPRAWVEGLEGSEDWRPASLILRTPNELRLVAQGPGRLVFSEVWYPGWQAEVDGDQAEVQEAYGLLRAVALAPGEHEVVLRFQPFLLYAGMALSLLGLAGVLGAWREA